MPDQYLAMTADPSHEESFHVPTQVSNHVMQGPYINFMLGMHCHIVWTQQSRQESAGQYIVLADMANAPCLWQESISDSVQDAPMVSWYTAL